jgi:hypothetical protein
MSLKNIFNKPITIDLVGNVHPIQIKDWEDFESYLQILMVSKNHIPINGDEDIPLLRRILIAYAQESDDTILDVLCSLFNLITKSKEFKFVDERSTYYFINENEQIINDDNYEEFRNIVLKQNIIIEPKVYKSKMMQEWAEKVLEARSKDAANITMEDMVTTVAVVSGKHYWDLEKYSIYQLKSEFQRINKIKVYDTQSIMFANPYASDIKLDHFAEYLDMYEDPYKDVFKSKDNMNITKAVSNDK